MKPLSLVLTALAAALLIAPPASAKSKKKHSAKASAASSAEARFLVKEGLARLDGRDYDAAIRQFERAARAESASGTYFLLGYAHYQKGFQTGEPETAARADAEETVNAYSMALALDPKLQAVSQPYRLYHSMALSYEALKAYDKAVDSYKTAFQAAPLNPMLPLYAARLRFRMGDGPKSASNLALSLKKARAAGKEKVIVDMLKNDPFFSVMMANAENRRVLAEFQGLPFEAQTASAGELRDSVSDALAGSRARMAAPPPQNPAVLEALAAADESYALRRYRVSVDQYNEALDLDAKSGGLSRVQLSVLYERMGTAYNKLGLADEAVRALRRSVQQMPNNSSAHYQIALAYSVAGKFSESLKALGAAFRAVPSSSELRRMMLLAKTDAELEPVRDLPGFAGVLNEHSERLARL